MTTPPHNEQASSYQVVIENVGTTVPSFIEGTPLPSFREGTPLPSSQEGTPLPSSRESTPLPSSREGTPLPIFDGVVGELVDTSKYKSEVWQHMKKYKIADKEFRAVCNYCNDKFVANASSGTRHMTSHYETCLRKKQRVLPKAFQKMLVSKKNSEGKTTIGNFIFDQNSSRRDLVEMVIIHEYPLSIVGHVAFKRFVNNLQPLFCIPSCNTVRSDVIKVYKEMMRTTMSMVDKNEGRVAITTDMWTADNQKKGYMAVTTHFVDASWRLQQRLLRFCYVPAPHTVGVIVEQLMNVLLDWNLDSKLSTITVDNCSVNDGVVETITQKLDNNDLLLGGSVLHMRCCAHILNLIVKDGLDVIGSSLEKVRDSCVFWSSTTKRIEKFEEAAKQLRITSTKKLCYDVKTRWNSTYIMLETALIYKDVFSRLKMRDKQYKIVPSEEDWKNVKIVSEKLKIFYDVTALFSGTKYTTSNQYFSSICSIKVRLKSWLSESNQTIVQMASKMLEKFEKYWSEVHEIMGVATVLDPRFKDEILEFYYEKLYGPNHQSEVVKVINLCRQLVREYQERYPKDQEDEHSREGDAHVEGGESIKEFHDWHRMKKRQKINYSSELDHYLEEGIITGSADFNVLDWWKQCGPQFPTLQHIARDIYAIPVSTVSSESAFSMGGRLISPQRNRLHPDLVEALACAQSWLKADLEEECEEKLHFKSFCDEDDDKEDQCATSMVTDAV